MSRLLAQKAAANTAGHCAHETTLTFLWVVRITGILCVPIRVGRVRGSLTAVLALLVVVFVWLGLTIRLLLAVLESAMLRWVGALLLLTLGVVWRRWSAIALLLISLPTILRLLIIHAALVVLLALVILVVGLLAIALLRLPIALSITLLILLVVLAVALIIGTRHDEGCADVDEQSCGNLPS